MSTCFTKRWYYRNDGTGAKIKDLNYGMKGIITQYARLAWIRIIPSTFIDRQDIVQLPRFRSFNCRKPAASRYCRGQADRLSIVFIRNHNLHFSRCKYINLEIIINEEIKIKYRIVEILTNKKDFL